MAYDSKTFGQSPFGNTPAEKLSAGQSATEKPAGGEEDLDKGPSQADTQPVTKHSAKAEAKPEAKLEARPETKPDLKLATQSATQPAKGEPATERKAKGLGAFGLPSRFPSLSSGRTSLADPATSPASGSKTPPPAKSRTSRSSGSAKSSARKGKGKRKQSKAAAAIAQSESEMAEEAIVRRLLEEDRRTYLALLYKTGISGLVWAVVRLLRHELPADAVKMINLAIHPLMIATYAWIVAVGLTIWMRHLLKDLYRHTEKLRADAEAPDGKSYRPTLEIVGDALEYNPKLRQRFAALYNAVTLLICSLISYLVTFALFPTAS